MKKMIAMLCACMLLCGCTADAVPTAKPSYQAGEENTMMTDRTLQPIPILNILKPEAMNLPQSAAPDDETGKFTIPLQSNTTAIILREWNATDFSLYQPKGVLKMQVKGTAGAKFAVGFGEMIAGEYVESLIEAPIAVTDTWQTVEIPLAAFANDFCHVRDFLIGQANGAVSVCDIRMESEDVEPEYPVIKADQLGYRPDAAKTAFVTGFHGTLRAKSGDAFSLVDAQSGDTVFEGRLTLWKNLDAAYSGEKMLLADFSAFSKEGTYYLQCGAVRSAEFAISAGVYHSVLRDAQRYFYYQRANLAIAEPFAEGIMREDATPEDFALPLMKDAGITKDVSGGWYDAGDVGKYISPGATAANTLLWSYRLYPQAFTDANNIPESGNGVPDLLDEIRYELDWFLRMQDESSGGFFLKAKSVTAQDEIDNRVVFDCSTNATADATATLAFASTVYRAFDAAYADTLLAAAKKGWQYIGQNPDVYYETNYAGNRDVSSKVWAAGALTLATGEAVYADYMAKHYKSALLKWNAADAISHSVSNMASYGLYCYMASDAVPDDIRNEITAAFTRWYDSLQQRYLEHPWNLTIKEHQLWWGSFNSLLANAQDLFVGCSVMGQDTTNASQISADAVHFVLGMNPLCRCFVTGHGSNAISCTFSNFYGYQAQGFPKGYMCGGINSQNGALISKYPLKCYVDEPHDWVTNENAVYWNAVLVFQLAANAGEVQ